MSRTASANVPVFLLLRASGLSNCTTVASTDNGKITFVYETSYYGSKLINTLNSRPIQSGSEFNILMLLHFFTPDENGFLTINTLEMADILHITERTVISNLHDLEHRGFIAMHRSTLYVHTFDVFITDYSKGFDHAKEGGKGFITFSWDLFRAFLACHTIDAKRVLIRMLYTCVRGGRSELQPADLNLNLLKKALPKSVTKKRIKGLLDQPIFRKLFDVQEVPFYRDLRKVVIRKDYAPSTVRAAMISSAKAMVDRLIKKHTSLDVLTDQDITDLSKIALKYRQKDIRKGIEALAALSEEELGKINSIGAWVRAWVQDFSPWLNPLNTFGIEVDLPPAPIL